MKKFITVICLLLSSVSFSQSIQEDITKIDTTEKNLFQKKQVKSVTAWIHTINQFGATNKEGIKAEIRMYDMKGNKTYHWTPSAEYSFKYDSKENRIECILKDKEKKNAQGGIDTQKEQWIYDAKNNCIQYLQFINGTNQFNTQFIYDESNHCIQENQLFNNNSQTTFSYIYDTQGNQKEKSITFKGIKSLSYKKNYDVKGNMIEETNYFNNSISFRKVMKYDSNNRMIEDIWYDENGNISSHSTFHYNENGKLIEKKNFDQTGKPIATSTYTYDANAKLISLTTDVIYHVYSQYYRYNDKGLIAEITFVGDKVLKYDYEYYSSASNSTEGTKEDAAYKGLVSDFSSNPQVDLFYYGETPEEKKIVKVAYDNSFQDDYGNQLREKIKKIVIKSLGFDPIQQKENSTVGKDTIRYSIDCYNASVSFRQTGTFTMRSTGRTYIMEICTVSVSMNVRDMEGNIVDSKSFTCPSSEPYGERKDGFKNAIKDGIILDRLKDGFLNIDMQKFLKPYFSSSKK